MSLVDPPVPAGNMAGMNPAKHAPARTRTPGLGAAWAVLIGTGVTSVTYNVVHAVNGARLEIVLALLLGFTPAFLAAFLSHVAAVLEAPRWVIVSVIGVMGAGMVLSASATAAVVAPAEPGWRGWLFGAVLDAAALLALWAILTARRRNNGATAAVEAAQAQAREAAEQAADAEEELATVKAELGAELEAVRAELEAARLRASARKPKRRPARKPAGISARASGAEDDDLDAEAAALKLWMADRTIPGSKLGPMVGRTDSWGRGAVRKFKQTAPEGHQDAR